MRGTISDQVWRSDQVSRRAIPPSRLVLTCAAIVALLAAAAGASAQQPSGTRRRGPTARPRSWSWRDALRQRCAAGRRRLSRGGPGERFHLHARRRVDHRRRGARRRPSGGVAHFTAGPLQPARGGFPAGGAARPTSPSRWGGCARARARQPAHRAPSASGTCASTRCVTGGGNTCRTGRCTARCTRATRARPGADENAGRSVAGGGACTRYTGRERTSTSGSGSKESQHDHLKNCRPDRAGRVAGGVAAAGGGP